MQRLDTFHPTLARDQTRIVEVAIEPTEEPREMALVESYPGASEARRDVAVLEVFDLRDRKIRAVVELQFREDGEGIDEVRDHPETPPGLDAQLLRAVVEGLVTQPEYAGRLREHADRFARTSEAFDSAGGPAPEEFEGVGRNEPCPCESGRKYKKCCLRRSRGDDIPERYDRELDDFLQDWRSREADSLDGVNQVLEALWSLLAVGGNAENLSERLLGDVGIEIRDDEIEEAARRVETVTDIPEYWREQFRDHWSWQTPLLEVVLPLVAEILWEARVPDRPRPHRIKSCIQGGYDADTGTDVVWERWYRGFDQLQRWVEQRDFAADELVEELDEALRLWDGVEQWIVDLIELARQRADEDTPIVTEVTDEALEIFAGVSGLFDEAAPALANDADVYRYAALVDIDRSDEALEVLEGLADKPIADEHAALYLGDLFVRWDFEAPVEHLERIVEFADRTIDEFDGGELEEVRQVRGELKQMVDRR